MQIKMDTDAVRSMSSKFRQTADSMDASLASIKTAVESAGWQSQAREEFIMRLEMLQRTSTQSVTVLRMMAQAADRKAEQWESIANIFNGPFQYLGNIWSSVVAFFSGIGSSIWNAITNIHLPSLPNWVLPSISGATIIGGIPNIFQIWRLNPPPWWPFDKDNNNEYFPGSGGGSWGGEDGTETENTGNSGGSSGGGGSSQPAEQKPYPQPPTTPVLREVNHQKEYTCAQYAAARRKDLGSTQCANEKFEDQAAANYICKYEDTAFQLDNSDENLKEVIGPGYALVWEPDHPGANDTYGHVAIVEEVYADHVIISESSKVNGVYQIRTRSISIDQLDNDLVWLIP